MKDIYVIGMDIGGSHVACQIVHMNDFQALSDSYVEIIVEKLVYVNEVKADKIKCDGTKYIPKETDKSVAYYFSSDNPSDYISLSDVYYFDVSLYDPDGKDYSYNRINTNGMGTYNWQVLTDEEINNLIDYIIDNAVEPIIKKQGK